MGLNSTIEWTEATWNPVTGCTKISAGCTHCYAERLAKRLKAMGLANYINEFTPTVHPNMLGLPLRWKQPRVIFVNSMSDLFHEDVPDEFIMQVFEVMRTAKWHTFQVLTKRPERLADLNKQLQWAPNIWMGVTVEAQDYISRIDYLRSTGAVIKYLSLEPLLSPIKKLNLRGIDWVIVGGESGPDSRPMDPDWVRDIRDKCIKVKVPFFFKQWGGLNKKKAGRILDGCTWDEVPAKLSPDTTQNKLNSK